VDDLTEHERDLRDLDSMVTALADKVPDDGSSERRVLWELLVAADLPAISSPASMDGSEMPLDYLATAVRRLAACGRGAPLAEHALTGLWLLERAGLRPRDHGAVVAIDARSHLTVTRHGSRWLVDGALPPLTWLDACSEMAVLAVSDGHPVVVRLARHILAVELVDDDLGDPVHRVDVRDLELEPDDVVILDGSSADELAIELRQRRALCRTLQIAGGAAGALELTGRHLAVRTQFGRTLLAMPAVRQQVGVMATHVLLLDAVARGAVRSAGTSQASVAIASAMHTAATSGPLVCRLAHQLHGAIGVTTEYPLHRLTGRIWRWSQDAGSAADWARELTSLVGPEPSAARIWATVVGT
jgi:acyl-CoA dehydrogenase